MRQGKFLFVILSLVGVSEVLGQNNLSTTGSVGIGTVNPAAKLHVVTTGVLPAAYFTGGNVEIVGAGNDNDALTVRNGMTSLQQGLTVGNQQPGGGATMKYTVDGIFEIVSRSAATYTFGIGSKINNVNFNAPVLYALSDMLFQNNSNLNTPTSNFKFFNGNTELATLTSNGSLSLIGDLKGNRTSGTFYVYGNSDYTNGPFIELKGNTSTTTTADIRLVAGAGNGTKKGDIVFARQNGATGGNVIESMMTIQANGNAGIGTSTPAQKLEVVGNMRLRPVAFDGVGKSATLEIGDPNHYISSTWGAGLKLSTFNSIVFSTGYPSVDRMRIDGATGNVTIANRVDIGGKNYTPTDATVKLAVAGTIVAQKVKVTAATNWGDFVFDKNYPLQPLAEVEQYVQANKHLPNIPSATELEASGLDTGEMLRLQMIKIEELTLHLIEQQKRTAVLEQQLTKLLK